MQPQDFLHLIKATDPSDISPGCWFGGLPSLGDMEWPRGYLDGQPLTFIAQIDLASLPQGIWTAQLPSRGSLAFFLSQSEEAEARDRWPFKKRQDAVLYVSSPGPSPTPAPDDLPPLGGQSWFRYRSAAGNIAQAPRLLRHWPMRIVAVTEPYDSKEAKEELIAQHEAATNAPQRTPESQKHPVFPYSVTRAAIDMVRGHIERLNKELIDELNRLEAEIANENTDDLMPPQRYLTIDTMTNMLSNNVNRRINLQHAKVYGFYDRIRSDIETWSTLSQMTREIYLRWIGGTAWTYHQMFGTGPFINGENTYYHDYHLLARFHYDEALGWDTGGQRDYKFLITDQALRRRDWQAAFVDDSNGA